MTLRDQFQFFHPLRVRWAECDAQAIVFNVNYLLYFDVAMTEYMRARGVSFVGDDAFEFYTVRSEANYFGSAVFDDQLDIGVRCTMIGNTSLAYAFAIFRRDELLTEGLLTYVHAEPGTKTKAPIPDEFAEQLVAFEKIPPKVKAIS